MDFDTLTMLITVLLTMIGIGGGLTALTFSGLRAARLRAAARRKEKEMADRMGEERAVLEARMDRIGAPMDRIGARVARLRATVRALSERVSRIEGQLRALRPTVPVPAGSASAPDSGTPPSD